MLLYSWPATSGQTRDQIAPAITPTPTAIATCCEKSAARPLIKRAPVRNTDHTPHYQHCDDFAKGRFDREYDSDRIRRINLFQHRHHNRAAGAAECRADQEAVSPFQVQERPAHNCNQANAQAKAQQCQKQPRRQVLNCLSQPQFKATLKKNQDEREHAQDMNRALSS